MRYIFTVAADDNNNDGNQWNAYADDNHDDAPYRARVRSCEGKQKPKLTNTSMRFIMDNISRYECQTPRVVIDMRRHAI